MRTGLLTALRPGLRDDELRAAAQLQAAPAAPVPLDLASPWAPTHSLARVAETTVWADIFGTAAARPVTRAEAMAVPAAARMRHVICSIVSRYPLRAYRGDQLLTGPAAPPWIDSTAQSLSPLHRMIWTVDDLIWYGWSAWSRVNDASGREPLRMDRLAPGRWTVEKATNRVLIDRNDGLGLQPARMNEIALIPGPHEGLLSFAQESIRHAADLQRAAGRAAKHPAAYLALKQVRGTPLKRRSDNPEEVTAETLTDDWAAAREGENGGVAFLSENVDAIELGAFDRHLVLDGRNAAAVDIARHGSLPADLVDAAGEHSLTYANVRDNDQRALDYGAGFYLLCIQAALSQDGITPHGQRVAFDLGELLEKTTPGAADPVDQAPTLAPTQEGTPA